MELGFVWEGLVNVCGGRWSVACGLIFLVEVLALRTHADTQTHARIRICTRTHARALTCTHTHTHTHTHAHTHTHTHAHTHTHTHTRREDDKKAWVAIVIGVGTGIMSIPLVILIKRKIARWVHGWGGESEQAGLVHAPLFLHPGGKRSEASDVLCWGE